MRTTSIHSSLAVGVCLICFIVVTCNGQHQNSSVSALNATGLDAAARTLLEDLSGKTTTGKFGPDTIDVGNYTLVGCSSHGKYSKADYLTIMLPTFLDRLRDTIADAELGVAGFYGYKAFFKSLDKNLVGSVFWRVQRGNLMHVKTRREDKWENPKIVCLGDEESESHVTGIGNLYNHFCGESAGSYSPVSQFRHSSLLVLCPSFFNLDPWPVITSCPRIINSGMWPDNTQLLQSQYSMLIRTLAGFYIPENRMTSFSATSDFPATLKEVINLPKSAALYSRDSYGYYAACESHFFSQKGLGKPLMLIEASC